ncbi:sensor histidine kinase [Archangium primigenium]|uniref:sensor histidine kinase n=1 Tax=[Archangium] primigenium TaxID=2792470 RepID=UPI00195A79BD|nr:HAMP domain-containing sensor histidine kinase [Archangium primigenium]MBM7118850.1 HAMP domain-containing histidine kinase [Archangium primigenium]
MESPQEGVERIGALPRVEARLQDEQRLLYASALVWLLFWGLDVLWSLTPTWDTLALRGGWAAATALVGVSLSRVGPGWRAVLRTLVAVVLPNVFMGLLILRLGGSAGHLFSWLGVMPAVALLVGGGVWHAVASTVLCLLMASLVLGAEGAPASKIWVSLLMLVFQTVGIQCVFFYQRLLLERVKSEAEKRLAVQELNASNERALRAERLAQVGRLAAGVAHEVRNPLAYVQANLRFLQEEWALASAEGGDPEVVEALQESAQGVERIHQIVKDLTALSRAEELAAPAGRCALGPVIDTSVRLASVRLKSLVTLAVDMPGAAVAHAEPRRLGQVLLNLLLNAADAIEDAKVRDGRVALRVRQDAERVWLLVEDNGPGIQAEHLSKLFTSFFTTKAPEKGTGLGLALSRQYVESFGGTLRAENRAEGGARFIVELPAV